MRNVLIALVGMSPAVVTETIWALAHDHDTPCMPDELVLITTLAGKHEIERHLAPPHSTRGPSKLKQMAKALRNKGKEPSFALGDLELLLQVICPSGDDDAVHTDVHHADELDHMGDLIFRTVKRFTEQPDTRVILSISGGRKSMGHLGGSAMTLLAREQDMMCHVLVTPPWLERCDDYFYPADGQAFSNAQPEPGETTSVQGASTAVTLSRVPFVRLNHYKSVAKLMNRFDDLGFAGTIDLINAAERPDGGKKLVIDWADKTVRVDGLDLKAGGAKIDEKAIAYLIALGLARTWDAASDDSALMLLRIWRVVDAKCNHQDKLTSEVEWTKRADAFFIRQGKASYAWPNPLGDSLNEGDFYTVYCRIDGKLERQVTDCIAGRRKNMSEYMSVWRRAILNSLGDLYIYRLPDANSIGNYVMPAALTLDPGNDAFDFIARPAP